MEKIIIEYNKLFIRVILTESNTSIEDSYRIKTIKDMVSILKRLRAEYDSSYAINKRTVFSMVNKWRAHNLLYSLHVKIDRTGNVDLNTGQSFWIKVAYFILSLFYF